jgi:hypothetical protein
MTGQLSGRINTHGWTEAPLAAGSPWPDKMTGLPSGRQAAPSSLAPAAIPRFYLVGVFAKGSHGMPQTEAVIRDSASGQITGQVTVLSDAVPAILNVAAYPDDRSFLIGTTEWGASGRPEYRSNRTTR